VWEQLVFPPSTQVNWFRTIEYRPKCRACWAENRNMYAQATSVTFSIHACMHFQQHLLYCPAYHGLNICCPAPRIAGHQSPLPFVCASWTVSSHISQPLVASFDKTATAPQTEQRWQSCNLLMQNSLKSSHIDTIFLRDTSLMGVLALEEVTAPFLPRISYEIIILFPIYSLMNVHSNSSIIS
jgi:hypothetical protein